MISRGYQVNAEDIGTVVGGERKPAQDPENRDDKLIEHVMARDFWVDFRMSPVWKRIEAELSSYFDPFREAPPFRMTIPGPSWVQVMGGGRESNSNKESRPSAVDLYDSI